MPSLRWAYSSPAGPWRCRIAGAWLAAPIPAPNRGASRKKGRAGAARPTNARTREMVAELKRGWRVVRASPGASVAVAPWPSVMRDGHGHGDDPGVHAARRRHVAGGRTRHQRSHSRNVRVVARRWDGWPTAAGSRRGDRRSAIGLLGAATSSPERLRRQTCSWGSGCSCSGWGGPARWSEARRCSRVSVPADTGRPPRVSATP